MAQIRIIDDSAKGTLFTFGFILTVPFIEASVKLLGDAMAPPQVSFTRFMLHVIVLSVYIYLYLPKDEWIAKPSWPLVIRGILASLGTCLLYTSPSPRDRG